MRGGGWGQPDFVQGDGADRAGLRARRGVQHLGQEELPKVSEHTHTQYDVTGTLIFSHLIVHTDTQTDRHATMDTSDK